MEMITLNLIPKGIPPVCHASQYDKGRVIRCNLVDGLQGYVLSGETAVLNVIKPDNNIVTEALTATTGNSYIDIITTEQMCAVAGKNECEIRLTKGEVEVGTLNFIMQVEADVTTGGIESETVIHNLETTISDIIKEEIEAISPEEELSGAMASFETHEIAPLVDCKVKIEAIQSGSGTPSPDNVRPITGFTGANIKVAGSNLWDEVTEIGGITWTTGQNSGENDRLRSKNYIQIKGGTTYAFSYTSVVRYIWFYDNTKTLIENVSGTNNFLQLNVNVATFTAPSNACYCRFILWTTYGTTYNNDVSINYPATDTAYHAYDGHTTAISWQDEAGTVYGGELDVTTGLLTATHARVDLGSLTWTKNTSFTNTLFVATVSDKKTNNSNCLCTDYINGGIATGGTFLNNMQNNNFASDSSNGIYIRDDSKASLSGADFKTAMSGVYLVYELATSQTYQLTPTEIKTILGVNNIWADTGDIDVVYHHELTARYVYFDNTGTDLTATNVEAAIKELWSRLQ